MSMRDIINVTVDSMAMIFYIFVLSVSWFALDKMQKKNRIFMMLVACSFFKALLDSMCGIPAIMQSDSTRVSITRFVFYTVSYIGTFTYNYYLYTAVGKQKKIYGKILIVFSIGMTVSIFFAYMIIFNAENMTDIPPLKYSLILNFYLIISYFADIFILMTVKLEKMMKYPLVVYSAVVFLSIFSSTLFLNGYSLIMLIEFLLVLIICSNIVYAQMLRATESEKKLVQNNIDIMVSQIQPHFLYNTLNSIAALCDIDPKEAKNMTINFSTYLRGNLEVLKDQNLITFSKELEHIKVYLSIEKKRFDERLNIVYDIKAENFFIPKLSVQPFVENAVKHGICKKREGGTVKITSFEDESEYCIKVEDDGVGFDVNNPVFDVQSSNIGIGNSIFRLKSRCEAKVSIESEIGKGTTVTVNVPKIRKNKRKM